MTGGDGVTECPDTLEQCGTNGKREFGTENAERNMVHDRITMTTRDLKFLFSENNLITKSLTLIP